MSTHLIKDTPNQDQFLHLKTIAHVQFTRREIDVLSCMVSGRPTKAIACLLNIAPKTVETHIHNLMLKIDCNSREGIINFVEKAGKFFLLRYHFESLHLQSLFEKKLHDALSAVDKQNIAKKILIYGYQEHEKLIISLKKYLGKSRIEVNYIMGKPQEFRNYICKFLHPTYIIYIACGQDKEFFHLSSFLFQKDFPVIALFNTSEEASAFLKKFQNSQAIIMAEFSSSYLLIFEILKKLFPALPLNKIISEFIQQYEQINTPTLSGLPPLQEKALIHQERDKKLLDVLKGEKKWRILFFVGICLIAFLFLRNTFLDKIFVLYKLFPETVSIRSDLPIPAETRFLQRPTLIKQLEDILNKQKGIQTVAIVGPGGAGKTTLARQYARYEKAPIIWEINAETPESLSRSFETLATSLAKTENQIITLKHLKNTKVCQERTEKIISFVKEQLKLYGGWILIYDNVEQFSDIKKYFPYDSGSWGNGKAILTTRNNIIPNCTYINTYLTIFELTLPERTNLFLKIQNESSNNFTSPDQTNIEEFLAQIPPFPLDVTLSAQYLKNTKTTYQDYLNFLYKNDPYITKAHEEILSSTCDYKKTRYGIIKLSIEKMISKEPKFESLLILLTLVDPRAIPKFLFEVFEKKEIVNDFLQNLHQYSLITYNYSSLPTLPTFTIHQSTQEIMLAYLAKKFNLTLNNKKLCQLLSTFEKIISSLIEHKDFPKIRILISHAESILKRTSFFTEEQRGSLGCEIAEIYLQLSYYSKAFDLLQKSYEFLQFAPSKSYKIHPKIPAIWVYKGIVEVAQGNFKKALDFTEKGVNIYREHFPTSYNKISWSLEKLSQVHLNLGNYKEMINCLEDSLYILKSYLPKDYYKLSKTLISLGKAYIEQGNFKKAKDILEEAYIIKTKKLSKTHTESISWTLSFLGEVYKAIGNYAKAEELFTKAKNSSEKYFPENYDHHFYFSIYLGDVLIKKGELKKAEILLKKIQGKYKKYFPSSHPLIYLYKYHLGKLYKASNHSAKAKTCFEKCLGWYKQNYGEYHPTTANIIINLAQVYLLEDNLDTSEKLLNIALAIFQQNDHPQKYEVLEILADLYLQKAKRVFKSDSQLSMQLQENAKNCLQEALVIVKTSLAEDSPHFIRIHSKLESLSI